jgi:hypothetical protein
VTPAPRTESLRWHGHWIGHQPRPATGTPADFLTGVEPSREFSRCMFRSTFDLQTVPADAPARITGDSDLHCPILGSQRGKAVPQVYVTYPPGAHEPPAPLKAFDAIRLEPGEVRDVSIDISFDDLAIFDDASRSRVALTGRYEIQIGVSSLDRRLQAAVHVGQQHPDPTHSTH